MLVIAGACDSEESKGLIDNTRIKLGERLIVLQNFDRGQMPEVYALADVFVLCAKKELFGIAFLEAMACGIPCIGHRYPVTEWVIGEGGMAIDMGKEGELASVLVGLMPEWV